MASRLRSAVRSAIVRASPTLAANLKLWRRTRRLAREEPTDRWTGSIGVDYREPEQLERLRSWTRYSGVFAALRDDPTVNRGTSGGPVENGWYATPDAEVYAAMIGDLRPRRVVEIGGGFSTRIARTAVRELGIGCSITVVDPEPRTDVADVADRVLRVPIQRVDVAELELEPGSILFVDSSHVALPGGDVPHVYGVLIPGLPAGSFVHVHDVFLPFDYPAHARRALYNEQYLLHALLSSSRRYRVELSSHLLSRRYPDELGAVIPGTRPGSGGSFWFAVERDG